MKGKVALKSVLSIILSMNLIVAVLPKSAVQAVSIENNGSTVTSKSGMPQLCAENDFLELYINDKTGDFYIVDKKSGNITYSVPKDADSDTKASPDTKIQLKSAIYVDYFDKQQSIFTMNSYADAVEKDQVSVSNIKNGVKIVYTMGKKQKNIDIPAALPKERMEKLILPSIDSERNKERLLTFFSLYSIQSAPDEDTKQKWLKLYPGIKTTPIYVFRGAEQRDYDNIVQILQDAGYTNAMYRADSRLIKSDSGFANTAYPAYFEIPLEITIEGSNLIANIDASKIRYNDKDFIINKVTMLPYFASGRTGQDGYVFLPDGSGAIVNFNNDGKKNVLKLTEPVYGQDSALTAAASSSKQEAYRLPVFGVKANETAIFGVIENGDAQCQITNVTGNIIHSYNTVYSTIILKNEDTFNYGVGIQSGQVITAFESGTYKGRYTVRYSFLGKENANLNGMAQAYKAYLKSKGALTKKVRQNSLPFYLDTYGATYTNGRFFGIPIKVKIALTTFGQADNMVTDLLKYGVSSITLRYFGFANGGLDPTVPSKLSVEGILGGKSGLEKLAKSLKAKGANLYTDADFTYVGTTKLFDGFSPNSDAIKTLEKRIGGIKKIDYATDLQDAATFKMAIAPKKVDSFIKKYLDVYNKMNIGGISAASMGTYLNSDFSQKQWTGRADALGITVKNLALLAQHNQLLTDGANAFSFKSSAALLNIPLNSSKYIIADKEVPFLQMVLHGYIPYAGVAINLSGDYKTEVLRAVSYGSGIHFLLNYQNSEQLKDTSYSDCYTSDFNTWKNEAVSIYKHAAAVLNGTYSSEIVDFAIKGDITITQYSNGKKVYVNYGNVDTTIDGVTVKARDFISA